MADYATLQGLVGKFRKGSPNIAAAFDEMVVLLKQQEAAVAAVEAKLAVLPDPLRVSDLANAVKLLRG